MRKVWAVAVVVAVISVTSATSASAAAGARAGSVHFRTPQGAMRYLAAAYNRNDIAALRHVTNPAARAELLAMRSYATNLKLVDCEIGTDGVAACGFTHDYPPVARGARHRSGGHAHLRAAPARLPGWVAKGGVGCG